MSLGKRVLVVDDDDTIRELIVIALVDEGFEVAVAGHGAEALEVIDRTPVDLILLDMRMPVMDGWEFARTYHRTARPHAPIVVLTAGRNVTGAALDVGAVACLPKPFELAHLLEVVDHALDGHNGAGPGMPARQ